MGFKRVSFAQTFHCAWDAIAISCLETSYSSISAEKQSKSQKRQYILYFDLFARTVLICKLQLLCSQQV